MTEQTTEQTKLIVQRRLPNPHDGEPWHDDLTPEDAERVPAYFAMMQDLWGADNVRLLRIVTRVDVEPCSN